MSGMVTVTVRRPTRKLWTRLPRKARWIAGRLQTSARTRNVFLADHQSSHQSSTINSDLRQEFLRALTLAWGQVFPSGHCRERNRGSRWEVTLNSYKFKVFESKKSCGHFLTKVGKVKGLNKLLKKLQLARLWFNDKTNGKWPTYVTRCLLTRRSFFTRDSRLTIEYRPIKRDIQLGRV